MSIDVSYITGGGSSATTGTTSTTSSNGDLDKQQFLDLLVAQLRNQDPSNPMDSSQIMTQTTQLSMMEAIEEVATTSRESFALQMRMSAADLVGRQVTWTDADGAKQTGVVTSVSFAAAVPVVKIGDTEVPLDSVSSVTATDPADTTDPTDTTDPDGSTAA